MEGVTRKEYIQLRLQCLQIYVSTASRVSLEKHTVIELAETGWQFAIKTSDKAQDGTS